MERLTQSIRLAVDLGQLALVLVLLRIAWDLREILQWTGAAQ